MRSRFHAAVDGAPVGILVSRLDGSTELVNERLRELVGVPAPEMPSIFEFLHPDDHADVIDSVLRMTRGEIDPLVKERRLVLRDGSPPWCRPSSPVLLRPTRGGPGLGAPVPDTTAAPQAADAPP